MATLFHDSSLLGFVPLEVLVHRGCGTAHRNAESELRVRGGPGENPVLVKQFVGGK